MNPILLVISILIASSFSSAKTFNCSDLKESSCPNIYMPTKCTYSADGQPIGIQEDNDCMARDKIKTIVCLDNDIVHEDEIVCEKAPLEPISGMPTSFF